MARSRYSSYRRRSPARRSSYRRGYGARRRRAPARRRTGRRGPVMELKNAQSVPRQINAWIKYNASGADSGGVVWPNDMGSCKFHLENGGMADSTGGDMGGAANQLLTRMHQTSWPMLITAVPQGFDGNSRVGLTVQPKYVRLSVTLQAMYYSHLSNQDDTVENSGDLDPAGASDGLVLVDGSVAHFSRTNHRVVIFQNMEVGTGSGETVKWSDIFQTTANNPSVGDMVKSSNRGRYRIVYDSVFTTDGTVSTRHVPIRLSLKGSLRFVGASALEVRGGHYYIMICNETPMTITPSDLRIPTVISSYFTSDMFYTDA